MSPLHRAFLYLTRKRGKTILLFLIILVIATLALSAISLKGAVQTAQLNVRESLGGSFYVEANTKNYNKYDYDEEAGKRIFVGKMPTKELAESISSQLDGLSGYCLTRTWRARMSKEEGGKDVDLVPGTAGPLDLLMQEQAKQEDSQTDIYITLGVDICTDSAFHPFFMNQSILLSQGRHITEEDNGFILISEDLAQKNGLAVGDTVYLRDQNSVLKENKIEQPTYASATIAGLFSINGTSESESGYTSAENLIITTQNTVKSFTVASDEELEKYDQIHFFAEDPADIVSMMKIVERRDDFYRTIDFIAYANNERVIAVEGPLSSINRLVDFLILLVFAIGVIILWLVLSSRIKDRIHETGILLSVGLRKVNILAQYLVEITVVTLLACTVAIFSNMLISNMTEDFLHSTLTTTIQQQQQETSTVIQPDNTINTPAAPTIVGNTQQEKSLTEISVTMEPIHIFILYGAGLLLSWVAVIAASVSLFRLKPREILSKMS